MRFYYITSFVISFFYSSSFLFSFEIEKKFIYQSGKGLETLKVISTTDIGVFEPIIKKFQETYDDIDIEYVVASSSETMKAIYDENALFDLVISSAMDLQTKIANDGLAKSYSSIETEKLPVWAQWRGQVFAFTQEPAVMVISKKGFKNFSIPKTRDQLVDLLRKNSDFFNEKIGTYDVRKSGLGYLFATQDSRNTDVFWRLTEIMGRLNVKLYCCSGDMLQDVSSGKLLLAYNVLGSYAETSLSDYEGLEIVTFDDFSTVMMRTALIPSFSENPEVAGKFIDFLIKLAMQTDLIKISGFQPVNSDNLLNDKRTRPIKLGPGLLVFLDKLRKENFIRNWVSSIQQN